jgi:class 3 adenylate cyclase
VACQACGAQNAAGQRFCSSCGNPLVRACRSCGASNEATARFCGACGASFDEPDTCRTCGESLPGSVDYCPSCGAAVGPAGSRSEERKVVSVLFVDLVGFTARSDKADPEDVQGILRHYYSRVRKEIEALGGTVEKFIGDAVVGVFGAPVAHEDDAERAVLAALGVLGAIDQLNEADATLDLSVRAAVNTGEAVVTLGARADEGEGFVAGDVVNTASRLQNVAPVGGVVVGELTHRATRDAFQYEVLEPVMVKGKSEPVPLWRVRSVDKQTERVAKAPLVGRSHELSLLSALWGKVTVDRNPHLVTVLGPPGIGKSRLLLEVQPRFEEGGRFVKGRCRPYGETTGYGAFGQQVKQVAGIYETDSSAQARTKLDGMVGDTRRPRGESRGR